MKDSLLDYLLHPDGLDRFFIFHFRDMRPQILFHILFDGPAVGSAAVQNMLNGIKKQSCI